MLNNLRTLHLANRPVIFPQREAEESRDLFFGLLHNDADRHASASRNYLLKKLDEADRVTTDFPDSIDAISDWIDTNVAQVKAQYADYLRGRKLGAPRRYFSNRSHALYFIKSVAPTKLVDGAWLYGLLHRWNDTRFAALIRIFLEELGDGVPNKNHVLLYKKLLSSNGCEHWDDTLEDAHFVQGAIQLSLAHNADQFLPEVIGFNLGYEQLPLHLLITSYELNELGIDPGYFRLHVTIDNASTGHANKSLVSVFDLRPQAEDNGEFFNRIVRGLKLNALGASTASVIASFDLEQELLTVLTGKSVAGHLLHSDYCRIEGRTVNEWLAAPHQIPEFLNSLVRKTWIKRGQDPRNSRFWNLIHGENAAMFGVFTGYEQQVIYDWIAQPPAHGSDVIGVNGEADGPIAVPRQLPFKAMQLTTQSQTGGMRHQVSARGVIRQHNTHANPGAQHDDFNTDLRMLEEEIAARPNKDEMMKMLAQFMSPQKHYTEAGLMATRIFSKMFG